MIRFPSITDKDLFKFVLLNNSLDIVFDEWISTFYCLIELSLLPALLFNRFAILYLSNRNIRLLIYDT